MFSDKTCHPVLSPHQIFEDWVTVLLALGHRVRFRAKGTSMSPTIQDGDAITVEPVAPVTIQVGDVVLYRSKRGVTAHRVVGIDSQALSGVGLGLRGDASSCSAEPVQWQWVLGKIASVDGDGRRKRKIVRRLGLYHSRAKSRIRSAAAFLFSCAAPSARGQTGVSPIRSKE